MKSTTLVIMAAGMGSRFGGGIKQLEAMGPNGEIIMDYSIYDAIEAGFNKVVFVTRKDLLATFKEVIGDRIAKVIPVEYAFQELSDVPEGFSVPEGRTKPWGTGQAVLACKGIVNEPFLVINADDYYGKEAFKLIHDFLVSDHAEKAEKHNVTLKFSGQPSYIMGNKMMMEELVYNLTDNAIRYNKPDGTVEVTVYSYEKDHSVVMKVKDTGIGIPEEHLGLVFQRFYRVDKSRSKSTGGTGLGLAIVKHIVAQHDAKLDITSEPNVGTEITITFQSR